MNNLDELSRLPLSNGNPLPCCPKPPFRRLPRLLTAQYRPGWSLPGSFYSDYMKMLARHGL